MSGEVSYAILGLLTMFDIGFVTNFFVIRAYRKHVDARTNEEDTKLSDENIDPSQVQYKASLFETILFGFVLGKVKPDPLYPQNFPNWRPIPFKFGVLTTSFLVLTSLALLTPTFLYEAFGLNTGTLNGEICSEEEQVADLIELNEQIEDYTHLSDAILQYEYMTNLSSAMVNDTTLYGTVEGSKDFTCPKYTGGPNDITGKKNQWTGTGLTDYPAAEFGNFFPGYCQAVLDQSIEAEALKTCGPEEVCLCPTLPNSQPWKFLGWAGKEICALKVCLTFDFIPCGGIALDQVVALENYRAQQLDAAAVRTDEVDIPQADVTSGIDTGAAETFNKLLFQFDVASNVYAVYSLLGLFFPVPLDVFRFPYTVAAKGFLFGAQKGYFMVSVVAIWWGYGYINQVLQSVEVQLFFANLLAGNPCYLDGAYIEARRRAVADACSTLQPMPSPFNIAATQVNQIAVNLEFWLDNPNANVNNGECYCEFPMQDTYAMREDNGFPQETYGPLGFTKTIKNFCARENDCTVYVSEDDIEFIGNLTLCNDYELAQELILQAPESEVSPTDMWISSGLLATLLIKFTLTNFAVSLLKIADPFVVCSGQFLWIPKKFGLGLEGSDKNTLFAQFKVTKEKTLFNINLRTFILWGVAMHLCLFNLMSSTVTTSSATGTTEISSNDLAVLQLCLGISAVVVAAGLIFIICLKRKPKQNGQHAALDNTHDEDGEGDDEDFEDDYSVDE